MEMDDPRWTELKGGYRSFYDPRKALKSLEAGKNIDEVWKGLWNDLHHQGDVGEASYAAVPHLVRIHEIRDVPDWNTYALIGTIEQQRHWPDNPPLPEFLADGYHRAWKKIPDLAIRDLLRSDDYFLTMSALGVIAMARGLKSAGRILLQFSDDEIEEMLREYDGV